MSEAGRRPGFNLTHLSLFSIPNLDDIEGHLMAQDVVWVNGVSVANLLAVWRVRTLGTTHRTDDGVGMLYRGTDFVEAVSEQVDKRAYIICREGDHAVVEQFQTRLLGQRPVQTPASSHSAPGSADAACGTP